jgi:glutamyl-tRNA synthetase
MLHVMPYEDAAQRLAAMDIGGGAAFWDAVKPNLTRLADVTDFWTMVRGPVSPVVEDSDLLGKAAELLPLEPWDEQTWPAWTRAVSDAAGIKGRALFHPLRLALTGRENGPELKKLLPLIGRTKALARLNGETA